MREIQQVDPDHQVLFAKVYGDNYESDNTLILVYVIY